MIFFAGGAAAGGGGGDTDVFFLFPRVCVLLVLIDADAVVGAHV